MLSRPTALLLILFLGFYQFALAQTCPPNLDFEGGDFSNWQCFTGAVTTVNGQNVMNLVPGAPMAGRHEIITANTLPKKDLYGNFPVFSPYGGNYSVKLGNNSSGGEAEALSYTFTVPTIIDTFTFTYFYAVVFEDPAHALIDQPRFFVTAYDVATGDVINCASYDYVSNGTLPGFEVSAVNQGVLFKNWSPVSLQFAGLGGRNVRLEFKTADCTLGGHFGYAYVDVGSGCSNILATAPYCVETNSLILNAPYGFKNYTWYNEDYTKVVGSGQSITFSPPPTTTGMFNVDAEPYPGYGCRDTFYAEVKPLPVPETPVVPDVVFCQNAAAPMLEAAPSPGNDIVWYLNDTLGVGTDRAPRPPTADTGTLAYYISQKTLFGCESFRSKLEVKIVPTPVASFKCNSIRQCEGANRFVFTGANTDVFHAKYYWDFGDGETLESDVDSVMAHTYEKSGNFTVTLKVVNAETCSSEQSMVVTVVPKPVAAFGYPAVVCQNQTQVSVTNNSMVPGGVASLSKWWWSFNGTVVQVQHPASFVPDRGGALSIKLVVATAEGCTSDTTAAALTVHYQPAAAFTYSAPVCNNEVIRFSNQSHLPQEAGNESVVKWDWQFPGVSSVQQHPSLILDSGLLRVRLVAESNFGCRSSAADSLVAVHAKPVIDVRISDSCVLRSIQFKTDDKNNSVRSWYWNFGAGWRQDEAQITRSYSKEGTRQFALIGQTVHGCRDTLTRSFTIYDNKAFAGKDTIAAMGEPVQLDARGGTNNTYLWSPAAGLSDATIEKPVATLDYDQLYQLDALTKEGCDSRSKIRIRRYKGPYLYIPTAFTPNGDGRNDQLKVFPVGIKAFRYLAVYNRYGELIFKTTDYATGWDGTYKKTALATGTFAVVAEAVDYRGKPMLQKGTVTLVR